MIYLRPIRRSARAQIRSWNPYLCRDDFDNQVFKNHSITTTKNETKIWH